MNHASLFSGIGGFDLAAEWMGWTNVFHCEINPFGQQVLKYYWPNSISYNDIKTTDFTVHRGTIDIITGGFPCQPYSVAGKRKGKEDDRHLWPEMLRAIREIQPGWVVGENVSGLISWNGGMVFEEVQTDLEAEGYEVTSFLLPACSVDAPHRRDRIWFVAHRNDTGNTTFGSGINGNRQTGIEKREQLQFECNGYGDTGTATDTSGDTKGPSRKSGEIERNGGGYNTQQEERGGTSEQYTGCVDVSGLTPDTNSNGQYRGNSEHEKQSSERGFDALNDIEQVCESASDTNSRRQSSKEYGQKESRFITEKGISGNWQNFPTQSPVCSRNDGLSSELSGITFSKHRNESIKAYGNAVVPQVVYQIFKTIETLNQKK